MAKKKPVWPNRDAKGIIGNVHNRLENLDNFVSEHGLNDLYHFVKLDISDNVALSRLFQEHEFKVYVYG